MKEVKVKRQELLEIVKNNMKLHAQEYKESCDGYREQALARIEEAVDRLKRQVMALREGEAVGLAAIHFSLPAPISHLREYEQAMKMLEMSVDEDISISEEDFGRYVMDEWDWKDSWEQTKLAYSAHR